MLRAYLSFTLVLASLLLIVSVLELQLASSSINLSKAVAVERAYGVQMNVKEAVLESVRQGAFQGFSSYDLTHDVKLCKHCPDSACLPAIPPLPPNYCDAALCVQCFREPDARKQAESYAAGAVASLHGFDDDFIVVFGQPSIEAFTRTEPLAKNGIAMDSMRFRDDFQISLTSQKFGISASSSIPDGVVISYD